MKKFYVLGVMLVAVCAVGVALVASASALTFLLAEWSEEGKTITATRLAEMAGEQLFEETLSGIKLDLLCSEIYDGFIGPDGTDEITELLNLSDSAAGEPLVGAGISCVNDENCAEGLFWAEELPWLTLLVLMEDEHETYFADLLTSEKAGGTVAYEVECMTLGLSDLCSVTEAAALVENTATEGLNVEFSDPFTELAGLKLFNCVTAGNEKGIIGGLEIMKGDGAGTLTVSE